MVQSIDEVRRRQQQPPRPPSGGNRVPPHNLQAEESLLGAMLLSRDAIAAVAEVRISADDFYKPTHGHIFDAVTSLYERGEPVDPVTVADELRRDDLLDAIGGAATLVSLQAATPATSNAQRYARIVEEHSLLRRLIRTAGEIAEIGYDLPDDVTAAIDRAEAMVFEVAQHRVTDSMAALRDLLSLNLDRLEALYERGEAITGTPTGYLDLDQQLSGLQPSALIIIGARPGAGKTAFALGMAAHAALEKQLPVLFFSLEMGHLELTQRLLCAEARVDSTRMRNGRLHEGDWSKINAAIGRLAEAPIYIDDNPNVTVMEIRAKARRLKSKLGSLGLIVIDYLQLMSGRNNAENRQVEVSEMSRGLKILARELEVPVVALSQLSRNLEMRADKRPVLADLRESGCLTADSRVLRADTGAEVTLGELLERGERDIPVWSVDDELRMVPATMTHVFPSGIKEVFELRLASGRTVKASANHPFLALDGWRRLDELSVGSRIAVPRVVPEPKHAMEWAEDDVVLLAHLLGDGCMVARQPLHYTSADPANLDAVEHAARKFGVTARRVQQENWWHLYLPAPTHLTHGVRNPIAAWLDRLGVYGLRSYEKFVPDSVFSLGDDQVALFLRHLWATDGCVHVGESQVRIYYASSSRRLAEDVRSLLLRLGVSSRMKRTQKGDYRPTYQLHVTGGEHQRRFLDVVGGHGSRACAVETARAFLRERVANTNSDTIPVEVWDRVRQRLRDTGVTTREFAGALGGAYCGSALYKCAPGRDRLARVAAVVSDERLAALAVSDVYWDRVVGIDALGSQPVYDATVVGTHNFVANGVIVHNSIEQDADVVLFIYRDEIYNPESADRGTAEIIVAKHRSGPTGKTRLAFLDHYTKFANMAKGV